ncbi:MAG: 16S rRNA (guanine(527)-N(7))-methyltransferase RsmG [Desulfomonilaceae bacterium]|nr:16S rRNA (guanine(527)-N(7))-methyltransferase RsmG [Desulfomonilaceae bacterium]
MTPLIREDEIAAMLIDGSSLLGVAVPEDGPAKMIRHLKLVLGWGAKMNLTSLRDPLRIAVLHFLDSLTVFKVLPLGSGVRVIDVGSGAGFPGMVLKIADPSLDVTLLDRNPRKVVFLKHAAHRLELKGITFLNLPVEALLQEGKIPAYDVVVSRALSSDPHFLDSLYRLLRPGGGLIAMTGPGSDMEGLHLPHFTLGKTWEGGLPFTDTFRRVSLYSRTTNPL